MELYDTEEEQVQAIKEWWKENGKAVIIGAVLGLGGIFGWRYYQDSMVKAKEAASAGYTQIISELSASGHDAVAKVQAYINDNKGKEYAVLAALQLARVQIDANEIDKALEQLKWAQANSKDDTLKPLIAYRVARVLAEQGHSEEALAELDKIKTPSWSGRVQELKGDILLSLGNTEEAYSAYTEAQQAGDASQGIQLKLDDLAK